MAHEHTLKRADVTLGVGCGDHEARLTEWQLGASDKRAVGGHLDRLAIDAHLIARVSLPRDREPRGGERDIGRWQLHGKCRDRVG